jgi:hypothetical protein
VLYPVICVEQWLADREDTHKTPEPAATIQVAAGSSKLAPVTETGPPQDAGAKNSRQGQRIALPA